MFYHYIGIHKISDVVFSQSVFNASKPKAFAIRRHDLNLQNILVDGGGNLTCIIN